MARNVVKVEQVIKQKGRKRDVGRGDSRVDATVLGNQTDKVVFHTLNEFQPLTRSELVKITNIPRSTLYDSLSRLILRGAVRKYPEKRSTPGRPKVYYECTV
ncbi:MAG: helix-turn-helix domain-containing protein [Promethearchaeota archaeon]